MITISPKISVVIPLYNKEHYIKQTIESVLSQTFTDFELIVVDDGSTDKSLEIVKQFDDHRICLLSEKNSGQAIARNYGIRTAKADLIAFLDADDEWYPDFLETIYHLYLTYPETGVYGTAYAVFTNNKFLRNNQWKPELGERVLPSYFQDCVEFGTTIFPTSAFAAQKKALEHVNGYMEDYRSGQDHDLFARLALYFPVCYSPKICARYNAGTENNFDRLSYAREVPLTRYLTMLPEDERKVFLERDDIQLFLSYYYLKLGGINIYGGFRKEGREQIKKVTERSMNMKKKMFHLMSYLPFPYYKIPPSLVRTIANKMKLAT